MGLFDFLKKKEEAVPAPVAIEWPVILAADAKGKVLIHVGVDTVDMNGEGFAPQVNVGDKVKKGQLVLTMDMDKIKAADHPSTVITVITNSDDFASIDLIGSGDVAVGDDLFKINK